MVCWATHSQYNRYVTPDTGFTRYEHKYTNTTEPSKVRYSDNQKTIVVSDTRQIQTNDLILLHWFDTEFQQKNMPDNHPLQITVYGFTQHTCDGTIGHIDPEQWSLSIKLLRIYWIEPSRCLVLGIPIHNGPIMIEIYGYKEYWKDGQFVRYEYQSIYYNWLDYIAITESGPDGMKNDYANNLTIWEKKFYKLLQTVQKPVTPLSNKFFNSVSDEMRFLALIQKLMEIDDP
jgi:hypothetical protein